MENSRREKKFIIFFLLFVLMCMSIAFASFSQSLVINGTAKVNSNQWNIIFDDIVALSTTGYATGNKNNDITQKNITFSCELLAANDSCELSFDIINKGTIDAMLKDFKYTVTSNGEELYRGAYNYHGNILDINLTIPTWTGGDTILKPQDKGNFKIKTLLKDISSLSESAKFIIDIYFDFEQK